MRRALLWGRGTLLTLAAVVVLGAMLVLGVGAAAAFAQSAGVEQESAGVRAVLARQLQSPGPSVVSQGGSGGSGDAAAPNGVLVPSLSTAFSDTWSAPREPLVTRIFNEPVNYRASDGQWHAIDNALVASPLGGYENAANGFSLRLPESLSSGVSVSSGGQSVSFALEGASTALPSVSGDTASYQGVLPSTDLSYVSQSSGVREIATLQDTGAPTQLRYSLSLSAGLSPRQQSDGSIALVDDQGAVWFTIPAPVAFRPDAGAASGRLLPSSIAGSGSNWVISVDTSEAWLREELATGAVAIDPTVTVSGTQACTINAESPKTGACASTSLQVGYDSTHQEHHGLLEFNLSSLPQAALVLNAKLGLYVETKSTSNAKAVGVYRVTKPWTTGTTWETYDGTHAWSAPGGDFANPEKGSDASVNSSVGASTGWYYWYPTKMVQEWVNTANAPEGEGYANDGLIVKDQVDNKTSNLLTVASPSASSNKPYIEVIYRKRGLGAAPQYTQLSTALTDKLTMSVDAASGNLLLESQDLHIAGVAGDDYTSITSFNSLNLEERDLGRWSESMFPQSTEYANGDVRVGNASNASFLFAKQANGTYVTPPGIKATLCEPANHTAPCPSSLPSGVSRRLLYGDPSQHYLDYDSSGWALHFGDRYGNVLTAGTTEGKDAVTSWTDTRGHKINYEVLPSSFYSEIKDEAGGRHVNYGYETVEGTTQLTSYTDANGQVTKYHYESGNLNKITTPKGSVVKFVYDSQQRVKEIVRTTNIEHTTGPTTKFTYYEVGSAPSPCTSKQQATVVKDPDWTAAKAHETTYCSNVLDEVEKTVDASGNETTATFNPFGDQTSTTAASPGGSESGGVMSLNYDEAGQNLMCSIQGTSTPQTSCPSSRPDKSALVTSYSYKDEKNLNSPTQVENPQDNSSFSCYNEGHQSRSEGPACPEAATGPAGSPQNENDQLSSQHELKFSYNTNGTIKSSTDADGHTTSYEYDEKGNLKKITPPAGSGISATTIAVDADSRPHVITDGAGHIETIKYDNLDRITEIAYTGTGTAKTVKYEYDADGNLLKREDSTGTTKYTVDSLNRVTKEELPESLSNSYEYDNASNMTSFTDGGGETTYKYNGLNELESMTEPKTLGIDKFAYDNDRRLTKITYPSGAIESYKLEPTTGRPETITAESVTGTTVPKFTYTYKQGENDTSLVQSITESTGNTTSYAYDALQRLTEAKTTGTSPSLYQFALDGAGNRTKQTVNPTGSTGGTSTYYPVNSANELECRQSVTGACSIPSELSAYTYDAAGEQTAITPKNDTTGSTFAFNAAGELSTLTPSGGSATSLGYGGTGQDDLVSIGSTTTLQNSLLGLTREITSGNPNCYERTPNGLLIDIRTPSGNYNPLYDAQGDIIALVSSTAKVERTFRYGPYGENIHSEGTQTIPYPFGYKGGYRTPGGNKGEGNVTNGLLHYGQRYYDPTTGRWTQQDPRDQIGSATQGNRFLFAGSDPVNEADPSGRDLAKDIFDGSSVAYGCANAETGVGAGFCAGGVYEISHEEVEESASGAVEGFEEDVRGGVEELY
jgi:RHS repeat-associated protein